MIRSPVFAASFFVTICAASLHGQEWRIPTGGNVYRTTPGPDHRGLNRDGILRWSDAGEAYSFYFHLDRRGELEISLNAKVEDRNAILKTKCGMQSQNVKISSKDFSEHKIGEFNVDERGYVEVSLQLKPNNDAQSVQVKELVVRSKTNGLKLTFVATDDGNMFYWGRRGPSVHLTYAVPRDLDIEYGYSELTIAKDQDVLGSYFMANGFGEGYFGMQVNSERERRVLFSVWSPFQTDDPKQIPADQKIELLAKGAQVKTGEFGNEGSGGQSFLIYPWKAGRTYRFLTQITPDGKGSTIYTSWFGDKAAKEWLLIASFRRPQTNTHFQRFHSFLENFNPATGHLARQGQYQNIWVRDTHDEWHECLTASFSVDNTGLKGHRLDFTGGAEGSQFFLRNCGFFDQRTEPGKKFTRTSSPRDQPPIDFDKLPRE